MTLNANIGIVDAQFDETVLVPGRPNNDVTGNGIDSTMQLLSHSQAPIQQFVSGRAPSVYRCCTTSGKFKRKVAIIQRPSWQGPLFLM
jgi:hypothetical protein